MVRRDRPQLDLAARVHRFRVCVSFSCVRFVFVCEASADRVAADPIAGPSNG
jgi:hypothetical protein